MSVQGPPIAAAADIPLGLATVVDPPEDAQWERFVTQTPGGDILQTDAWAQTKKALGFDVGRVIRRRGGMIAGGSQIIVKRLGPLGGIGYIARGPVLCSSHAGLDEELLDGIHAWCRDNRVRHLIVQPGENAAGIADALAARGYIGNAPAVAPTATIRVDLRQSLDEILSRMSAARRRDIRLAERNQIDVSIGGEADLDVFCAMHEATAQRQEFAPLSRTYLQRQWNVLHPLGWLQLFVARHEGRPIAGISVTAFADRVSFRVAGWTGEAAKFRCNAACHWSAIQWARRQGYRHYDFGDFDRNMAETLIADPNAAGDHAQSPEAFKHRFGGDVVLLPKPLQFTFNPVARAVTRMAFGRLAGRSSFQRFIHRFRNG